MPNPHSWKHSCLWSWGCCSMNFQQQLHSSMKTSDTHMSVRAESAAWEAGASESTWNPASGSSRTGTSRGAAQPSESPSYPASTVSKTFGGWRSGRSRLVGSGGARGDPARCLFYNRYRPGCWWNGEPLGVSDQKHWLSGIPSADMRSPDSHSAFSPPWGRLEWRAPYCLSLLRALWTLNLPLSLEDFLGRLWQ